MNKIKTVSISWKIIAVVLSVLLLFMGIHVQSVKAFASDSIFSWFLPEDSNNDTFKELEDVYSDIDFDLSIPDGLSEDIKSDIQRNKDNFKVQLETGMELINQPVDEQVESALAEDNGADTNLSFLFSNILSSGANAFREEVRWYEGGQGLFNDKIDHIGHGVCGALNVCTTILHVLSYAGLFPTPDKTAEYLQQINEIRAKMGQYHAAEIKELQLAQQEIGIQDFVDKFEELYGGTVSLTTALQICGEAVAEQTQVTDCRGEIKNINEITEVTDFDLLEPSSKNAVIGFYSAYDDVAQTLGCNEIIETVETGIAGLLTGDGNSFKYVDIFTNWAKYKSQYAYEARESIFDYNCFIFNILEEALTQAGNLQFMYYRGSLFSHSFVESELDKYKNSDSTRKTSKDYEVEYLSIESIMKHINEISFPELEKQHKDLEEELEQATDEKERQRIQIEILQLELKISDLEKQYEYYNSQLSLISHIKNDVENLENKSEYYKNNADHWCQALYYWGIVTDKVYPASEEEKNITTMMMRFLGYWQIFAVEYEGLARVTVVDDATSASMEYTNIADAWVSACSHTKNNNVTINIERDLHFPNGYNLLDETVAHKGKLDEIKDYFNDCSLYFDNQNQNKNKINVCLGSHSFTWDTLNKPIIYVKNIGLNITGANHIGDEHGVLSGAKVDLEKAWSYGNTSELYCTNFVNDGFNIWSSQKYDNDGAYTTVDANLYRCEFNNLTDSAVMTAACVVMRECLFQNCQSSENGGAIRIGWNPWSWYALGGSNPRMPEYITKAFDNAFIHVAIMSCNFINCSSLKNNEDNPFDPGGLGDSDCSKSANNGGGAVYSESGPTGFYNCEFSGNRAENANGGAIYTETRYTRDGRGCPGDILDSYYIKSCNFHDNYAKNEGGAIYSISNTRVHLQDSTIINNQSGYAGGGIYVDSYTANAENVGSWEYDYSIYYFSGKVVVKDNYSANNPNNVLLRLSRSEYWTKIEHAAPRFGFDNHILLPESEIYMTIEDWRKNMETSFMTNTNMVLNPSCFKRENPGNFYTQNGKDPGSFIYKIN